MSKDSKPSIAAVIIDDAIDRPLDYLIPSHLLGTALPGTRVLVPVRGSLRKGTLFSLKETSEFSKLASLREILSEKPLLSQEVWQLIDWMASYYCSPLRKVLPLFLPPGIKKDVSHKMQKFVTHVHSPEMVKELINQIKGKSPAQARALAYVPHPQGILLSDLCKEAKISQASVETLVKKNILSCDSIKIERDPIQDADYFPIAPKTLSEEQAQVFASIKKDIDTGSFSPTLLYGVTGSGKTEVYLNAIQHTLDKGKNVLMLVPEISLTSQNIENIKGRFSASFAVLHHRLSQGERHDSWHRIASGNVSIVLGARSAIFAPLPNIGLIIVDEEHDNSYKQQDDTPCYQGRDVAVMRAKISNCSIILGSATPSLESYQNALSGRYTLSQLKHRPVHAKLPTVHIVNMQIEKNKGSSLFSEPLLKGIKKRLENGEQTLLFLNRRGYYTIKTCEKCQHNLDCPHCDISMTFHKEDNRLACHLCSYEMMPAPRACPKCGELDSFTHRSPGTEQIQRAIHAIFPDCKTLRLDADTTKKKGSHEVLFKQFRSGKADILIGTQMIAKGLNFPMITLVGIIQIDGGLHVPDFRASEQVFQLITQVAGRSGRSTLPGEVIIQTFLPEHATIRHGAAQDFTTFSKEELESRKFFNYPPFTHMIKCVFSSTDANLAEEVAKDFRSELVQALPADFEIQPVVEAGHAKVKDHYRFQFLLRGPKLGKVGPVIQKVQAKFFGNRKVRIFIDVDPISTFF